MDPDKRENTQALLERLLAEGQEKDAQLILSSQQAIRESRELLERIWRAHPDID